ncbi:hypothetical protein ACQW02_27815 [Humitalea sp. 24SJ18S-53]|uniref:hypothetical protein n=1 Tax=Humitalea sp. 24SJ18S-53 TaxID=3422307 RepID=UPI003D677F61
MNGLAGFRAIGRHSARSPSGSDEILSRAAYLHPTSLYQQADGTVLRKFPYGHYPEKWREAACSPRCESSRWHPPWQDYRFTFQSVGNGWTEAGFRAQQSFVDTGRGLRSGTPSIDIRMMRHMERSAYLGNTFSAAAI